MKQVRWWLLALLAGAGLAVAGDAGVRTLDLAGLEQMEPPTGDVSSGQPSAAQLDTLAEKGFVAVIDLRGPGEDRGYAEAAAVEAAGLEYSALPITGADAVTVENARKLGAMLDSIDGPALVHCGSGNRVGALVALLEADRGASAEDALEAGRAAGLTRLEGLVREQLEMTEGQPNGGAVPES